MIQFKWRWYGCYYQRIRHTVNQVGETEQQCYIPPGGMSVYGKRRRGWKTSQSHILEVGGACWVFSIILSHKSEIAIGDHFQSANSRSARKCVALKIQFLIYNCLFFCFWNVIHSIIIFFLFKTYIIERKKHFIIFFQCKTIKRFKQFRGKSWTNLRLASGDCVARELNETFCKCAYI